MTLNFQNIYNKLLVFLVIFIISCSTNNENKEYNYITDYYPLMIQAEIAFQEKDYKKAYDFLSKAFKTCPPRNTTIYYEIDKMAEITARLGYNSQSIEMIRLQIDRGYELNTYTDNSLYDEVFKISEGQKIIKDYGSLHQDFIGNINHQLISDLVEMSDKDQLYRSNGNYKKFRIEQEKIDTINEKKLIDIFESYGYPEEDIVRFAFPEMIRIKVMLLHTNDSIRVNYFLPKLKEFVKQGKCDPSVYATVYDQYYLYNQEPQIYGTYTQNGVLSDHIDLVQLNENRKSIGLPTLEQKDRIHNLKIKNYPDTYGKIFSSKINSE